jgi:hypothetical protein
MKIVNIDAPENLTNKVVDLSIPEFVIEVVRPLEKVFYSRFPESQIIFGVHSHNKNTSLPLSPIWKFEEYGYENIAALLHSIPIYLRDSRPELIRDENSIIDLLGAYYSNRKGDSPYIELYLTAINSSINDDKHFRWLFTKVLIHELAHAALDIFNWEHNRQQTEKISYHTEFGKWREESMANAMTLRVIKYFGNKDFYDYAKQFMQSQPAEYALGVLMEDFDYWDFRSVFNSKEQGVDSNLQQEWLNYVKGTPDWEGLNKWNELLNSQYVYTFEGKYYSSEGELVYTIVKKVLSDYENTNGGKMSFNTFISLFPNITTGAENAYKPTQKGVVDSRYKEFKLADGDYSLYYFWNNDSLHKFIEKLDVNIIEYKNY